MFQSGLSDGLEHMIFGCGALQGSSKAVAHERQRNIDDMTTAQNPWAAEVTFEATMKKGELEETESGDSQNERCQRTQE